MTRKDFIFCYARSACHVSNSQKASLFSYLSFYANVRLHWEPFGKDQSVGGCDKISEEFLVMRVRPLPLNCAESHYVNQQRQFSHLLALRGSCDLVSNIFDCLDLEAWMNFPCSSQQHSQQSDLQNTQQKTIVSSVLAQCNCRPSLHVILFKVTQFHTWDVKHIL